MKVGFAVCLALSAAGIVNAAAPSLVGTFTVAWPANNCTQQSPTLRAPDGFLIPNPFACAPGQPVLIDAPAGDYYLVHVGGAKDFPCGALPCSLGTQMVCGGPQRPISAGYAFPSAGSATGCTHTGGKIALFFADGFCCGYDGTGSYSVVNLFLFSLASQCDASVGPCITNPRDGATPGSAYVALSGVGTAGATVDIIKDGSPVTAVIVSQSGTWEAVVDVGAGPHIMRTRYTGNTSSTSPPVNITNIGNFSQPPRVLRSTFEKMRTADVILELNLTSPQIALYGPNYSHAALFLGGDTNGTPLIAEAVTAQEGGSLGQVRAVPLEWSTVYTDGRLIDFYRRFDITDVERASIVSWAAGVTAQGLPYFNVATDLGGPFITASLFWDFQTHQPKNVSRFNLAQGYLGAEKFRTDKFICSTLVWRSYYEGTGHRVDISLPNNIVVSPASVLGNWVSDAVFINSLRPYFVFPDTIALSGKLSRVP